VYVCMYIYMYVYVCIYVCTCVCVCVFVCYRQAIKMNPGYVPALLEYARFQIEKGDLSMAEHYFKHTLKKDPSNAEVLVYSSIS